MNKAIKFIINAALMESYVSEALKAKRESVCATCEFHDHVELKCGVCGCYTDIKAGMDYNKNPKRNFAVEKTHCPKGKWPYIQDNIEYPSDAEIADIYNKVNN